MRRVVSSPLPPTVTSCLLVAAFQVLPPHAAVFAQDLQPAPQPPFQAGPGRPGSPASGQPFGSAMTAPQPYGQPAQPFRPFSGQPGYQPGISEPTGSGPLLAPPITFIDINSGRFDKLDVDLEGGQFLDGAVDKLNLTARNMDLTVGTLNSLAVEVTGGHFQDFTFDRLSLNTQGMLSFDTAILFNHRTLQFLTPAQAEVWAVISQDSLNRFLNSPRTLNRLSVAAAKGSGILESLLGSNPNLMTIAGANVALQKNNRMLLSAQTRLGVGQLAVPVPLELNTQMLLKDGWLYLSDTHLTTAGQEISPQLSQLIVDKVNGLAEWGHRSDDITFNFTTLRVVPGDKFVLQGTAQIKRLRFGRNAGL